jgi:hypothetical protein
MGGKGGPGGVVGSHPTYANFAIYCKICDCTRRPADNNGGALSSEDAPDDDMRDISASTTSITIAMALSQQIPLDNDSYPPPPLPKKPRFIQNL